MRSFLAFVRFDNDPNWRLSKDEHRRWKVVGLIYLLLWLAMAIVCYYLLNLPAVLRWTVLVVLIIGTPALSDLWESYDHYVARAAKTRLPRRN
jgi:hypothetical protein